MSVPELKIISKQRRENFRTLTFLHKTTRLLFCMGPPPLAQRSLPGRPDPELSLCSFFFLLPLSSPAVAVAATLLLAARTSRRAVSGGRHKG